MDRNPSPGSLRDPTSPYGRGEENMLHAHVAFGMVFQIASATSAVAAPMPRNSIGSVAPNFCRAATSTVAPVMKAALSTLTAATVRARKPAPAQACTAA